MSAVKVVRPHLSTIRPPAPLRDLTGWLVWRFEQKTEGGKPRKVPYYTGGGRRVGTQGSPEDRAKLTTFDAALNAAIRGGFDGVGLVLLPEFNLIALDFDDCLEHMPAIESLVAGTYAEFSPSGKGVRAFMRGRLPDAKDTRHAAFGVEVFSEKGYVTFTGNRLQTTDLCGAEDTILNLTDEVRALYVERFGDPDALRPQGDALPLGLAVGLLHQALDSISPDVDHDTWLRVGMALHHETEGKGFALWNDWSRRGAKYPGEGQLRQRWKSFGRDSAHPVTVRSLVQIANDSGAQINLAGAADDFDVIVPEKDVQGQDKLPLPAFARDKNGRPEGTIVNLLAALRRPDVTGMQLGFDTFRDEIMWTPPGTLQWRPFRDTDYTALRALLESRPYCFKPIGRELVRDAVLKVAEENQFDSAIAWLDSLEWDGVPRIERFISTYFNVADTEYHRAVSFYLWTALAGRVLQPGCKADMVPVLIGAQGIRKSTAVAALAPSPEYFTEFSLADRDADLSRKMRGKLVAEIGELRGLHTRDMEWIKNFITSTHERWTPKYKEFETVFARRLVFIATTNEDEFLADLTGNRRWLPVKVGQADVDGIKRDLHQLWAEGAEMFSMLGISWSEAERLAAPVHAEHMISDAWEPVVREWLDVEDVAGEKPATRNFLRVEDVLKNALGFDLKHCTYKEERRVGAVLRKLGYEKGNRRIDGKQTKVWVLPVEAVATHVPF